MGPGTAVVKGVALPRGRGLLLLLDISLPAPKNFAVSVVQSDGSLTPLVVEKTYEEAFEDFDAAQLELQHGCTGLNAVLARCMGKVEQPVPWKGSAAEYASRFFPIGTWGWVQTLVLCRQTGGKAAA